jgi:tRNA-specific 2-thiouridylase
VTIGREEDLLRGEMTAVNVNWLLSPRCGKISVKIRSRHEKTGAEITEIGAFGANVRFDAPQKAVTPGQAAVFYDGDRILGGGWIK